MDEQDDKEGLELKGIKLPAHTILPTHKRELKKALFEIKPENKTLMSQIANLFTLRPIWKPVAIGALVIVLIVSLTVIIPPIFGDDLEVMAADIALNNPEIINAFNDVPNITTRVTEIAGDIATVEIIGESGVFATVTVDVSSKTVMWIILAPPQTKNFTDEELVNIITILQSDHNIKTLLDQGAVIMNMSNYHSTSVAGEDTEKNVRVTISLGDELFTAEIDLISGQLLGFGDYATMEAKEREIWIAGLYEDLERPDLSEEDRADILGLLKMLGEGPATAPSATTTTTPTEVWSPEGFGIMFVRTFEISETENNSDIYIINADGSNQTCLVNNPASDWDIAPSPDGSRIAFSSNRNGYASEIYLMDINGSNLIQLTNNPGSWNQTPIWSPDGSQIAFTSDRDGNQEIYVMKADGLNQNRLTSNLTQDFLGSWSPDSSQIAYSSIRDGSFDIIVMDADGSNQTNLTDNPSRDWNCTWSPDGSRIAFTSNRKYYNPEILNTNHNGFHDSDWYYCEIYVMDADGSNLVQLTDLGDQNKDIAWSPDGSRIAFSSKRGGGSVANYEIYVMDADGSNVIRLTNNFTWDSLPIWSPDGLQIVFVSTRGLGSGNSEIYVMNADGSNQIRLTDNSWSDFNPAWLP